MQVKKQLLELDMEHVDNGMDMEQWCIGEGNGNPLQYSCLENPTDWIFLQPKGLSRVFSNTTVKKHNMPFCVEVHVTQITAL